MLIKLKMDRFKRHKKDEKYTLNQVFKNLLKVVQEGYDARGVWSIVL